MNIQFRNLRPDEVEVRPAEAKDGRKATLLLYQDARCAMNILDSMLGPMAWQREYYEAAGLLFCKIGIYDSDSNQWLWKSDTGSKSNIEEDKGLASDAFKRAAVAWGIGRELYTAPRITIDLTEKDLFNGKLCQSFHVGNMEVKVVIGTNAGDEGKGLVSGCLARQAMQENKKVLYQENLLQEISYLTH